MNEISTIAVPAGTSLATIDALVPEQVFAPGGIKAAVTVLKAEVRAQAASLDISTEKGRKQIASLAYKVAQSKTALDKIGKDLTADWQRQTNLVNEDRRYLRDEMDALKDEVRKPLDDYLASDAARIAAHEAALAEIEILASVDGLTADQINERIWKVPAIDARPWQEFRTRAERAIALTLERLQGSHAIAVQREEAAARAEQERLAEIERQRVDGHQAALNVIRDIAIMAEGAPTSIDLRLQIDRLDRLPAREWEEFQTQADVTTGEVRATLLKWLADAEAAEAVAKAAHDAKVAADAAEVARKAAEAEAQRIAGHQAALDQIPRVATFLVPDPSVEECDRRIEHLRNPDDADSSGDVHLERDWEEFSGKAREATQSAIAVLTGIRDAALAKQRAADALAQAELDKQEAQAKAKRLAEEAEAARVKGHEDALDAMNDASNVVPGSSSETIRATTQAFMNRPERDWQEFADEATALRAQCIKHLDECLEFAVKREVEDATRKEQEAAAKVKRDSDAAVAAEQQRVAAQQAKDQAEADRRAANAAHRRKVDKAALTALMAAGLSEGAAKTAIEAIAKGSVPRMTIDYGSAA